MAEVDRKHRLFGCYSKLERARVKMTEVSSLASTYIANARYRIDYDEMPGDLIHVVLRAEKPVDEDLHHEAAELVYHLRSILDQMFIAVVTAEGIVPTHQSKFPAMKYEKEFAAKTKGLSAVVTDLLYRERPWSEGGDSALCAMQELANVDKHNFLIPFGAALTGMTIRGGIIDGGGHPESVGLVLGGAIHRVDLIQGYLLGKIGKNGSAQYGDISVRATIAFGSNAGRSAYREALPAFEAMIEKVASILTTFHRQCFPD